ncbi:MAG: hypothetical protein IKP10_03590 [Clostridia bacterium]|nr:hypothetical protein [Clostridia bacterium]
MAERMQRKFFQNFIDASMNGTTPSYYRLGKDLEEFNIEMNPDTENSKNILGESTFIHNGYEISADADPFYARTGDAMFEQLQKIIDEGLQYEGCATNMIEVHLWDAGTTSGTYKAYKQGIYVVPTSYGGDTSGYQIPFTVNYVGEKKSGYFTPDGAGSGTFAPDA